MKELNTVFLSKWGFNKADLLKIAKKTKAPLTSPIKNPKLPFK
jgi:hypothetical protein